MVKDIFGRDRFHCTKHGCKCLEFQSEAQRDLAKSEGDEIGLEEMESRYHSMTCQAKSIYQQSGCAMVCFGCFEAHLRVRA